jgi:tetratricopeptide (TPR) repeat protein
MIGIYAPTELHADIKKAINEFDRLEELITLYDAETSTPLPNGNSIVVKNNIITQPPDWFNSSPPILFPDSAYRVNTLMGLVFVRLSNFEAAQPLLHTDEVLWKSALLYQSLLFEEPLPETGGNDSFESGFNEVICLHYATPDQPPGIEQLANRYELVLQKAPSPDLKAFVVKHYSILLIDAGMNKQAEALINTHIHLRELLGEHVLHELLWIRSNSWMQQLQVPYDDALLSRLKEDLWQVLSYLEKYNRTTEQGMLLTDAAQIANISDSFAEALGYISKAIQLLQADNQTELAANAQLKKGILLYTWAQKGQPQFYRGAKDALLNALLVFTREAAPHVFADIHHYLGIIYSEIPDEIQKKSVWAGVSVSSFYEAIDFYNKVDYPYEFAQICNHFANAFTKYPAAAMGDNYEKALAWYREALDIRKAETYPLERSLTLSNYLDAAWKAGNPDDGWNEDRWNDMWHTANELKEIAQTEALKEEAQTWLDALVRVKAGF